MQASWEKMHYRALLLLQIHVRNSCHARILFCKRFWDAELFSSLQGWRIHSLPPVNRDTLSRTERTKKVGLAKEYVSVTLFLLLYKEVMPCSGTCVWSVSSGEQGLELGCVGFGIALQSIHKFVLPWLWLAAGRLVNPQGRTHLDRMTVQKSFVQRLCSTYETGIQIPMLTLHHFP